MVKKVPETKEEKETYLRNLQKNGIDKGKNIQTAVKKEEKESYLRRKGLRQGLEETNRKSLKNRNKKFLGK